MMNYQVIARFRQPGSKPSEQAIVELRQYGDDVARCVNDQFQEWTAGFSDDPWYRRVAVNLVQGWVDFEHKIGSELEQWVKLS